MNRFRLFSTISFTLTLLLTLAFLHSHRALDRLYLRISNTTGFFVTSAMGTLTLEYRNDHSPDVSVDLSTDPWTDFTDPLVNHAPEVRTYYTELASASWLLPRFTIYRYAAQFTLIA